MMKKSINFPKAVAMLVVLAGGMQINAGEPSAVLANALPEEYIDGYVVSGHIRLNNYWSRYGLEKMLAQELTTGENTYDFYGENLKIVLSGTKAKYVSMEFITKNRLQAENCRKFWQYIADMWGGGEIIGITVMARAYEEMCPFACEEFCAEIASVLDARGRLNERDKTAAGVYYSPQLAKGIKIAGEKINCNIAICPREGYTDIYLGYPVIYQTY